MAFFKAQPHPPLPSKDIASWIFDSPSYDPDRPVFVDATDPSRSISLNQARVLVRKFVAGFHNAGLKAGDCVCIQSFNDIYYPVLALGIIAAGGVWAGANPSYTPYELAHHIKTTKADFLISEPELLKPLLIAAKEREIPTERIRIFNPLASQPCPSGYMSWNELLQHGEKDWVRFDDPQTCRTTAAVRFASSGTTGLPKATTTTHLNLIAQHELYYGFGRTRGYQQIQLWSMPMFHAALAPRALTTAFKNGEVAYIMRRFELEHYLRYTEQYQVTEAYLVPPMVISIIMSPLRERYSLKSTRQILAGAAPLGKEAQARMKLLLEPGTPFTQVWGKYLAGIA